jgi:Sugar-binding N-terminal domain
MTRADPTANLPPVRVEPDARRRIRRALAEAGRRIAVLDDDPTGSQTVHDVDVVTVFEPDEIAAGFSSAGSTCFFLTNTRSLSEADAVELNTRIGRMLIDLAARLDAPIDIVSRSDSTPRGHRHPAGQRDRVRPRRHLRIRRLRPARLRRREELSSRTRVPLHSGRRAHYFAWAAVTWPE